MEDESDDLSKLYNNDPPRLTEGQRQKQREENLKNFLPVQCEKCGSEDITVLYYAYTAMGFKSPPGHEHNINHVTVTYNCNKCTHHGSQAVYNKCWCGWNTLSGYFPSYGDSPGSIVKKLFYGTYGLFDTCRLYAMALPRLCS
jgi:hypothetical protein